MLLEPEVIHMTCMYQELFHLLYSCYTCKPGLSANTGGSANSNSYSSSLRGHMELDNFLALCHDLELIPAYGTSFAFENAYKQ